MGFLSKIFRSNKDEDVRVKVTISEESTPTKQKVTFSDNDPSVLDNLDPAERISLDKPLPFSNICPCCGIVFDKPIKRKKACAACKGTIYVRTTQDLYPTSALTEEQVNHVDFYFSLKSIIFITKDDFIVTENLLKAKWNVEKVNTYDVLWSLYNNLDLYGRHIDETYGENYRLGEILRRKEWTDEAAARYQAGRGHDPAPYLEGAKNNAIQSAKLYEGAKGLTVIGNGCCDACMKLDGKTFSLEFLNKTPVLPNKNCTHPFSEDSKYAYCTCGYRTYFE